MILIINSGSSSIKMAVIEMASRRLLADGLAERLGEKGARLRWHIAGADVQQSLHAALHHAAMETMLDVLFQRMDKSRLVAVGHRVVHGGEQFVAPTVLDETVIAAIESLSHLAPLHNPANLLGIRAALAELPAIAHVAVFDTAFHHAMPLHASLYAVPYHWYSDYGVRRYGFHGTSHHYVAREAATRLKRPFAKCQLLTAHLGNGCSTAAVRDGGSVDTSMGMTPLAGLVMGTRSGDVDPGLHAFMARESGATLDEITDALNRQSGLLGLSGSSNDMRTLLDEAAAGSDRAALAVEVFCYRLAQSLASLAVALQRVDAIIFTGGIGEHAAVVRSKTAALLAVFDVSLDAERNNHHGRDSLGFISAEGAGVPVLVIPTNEEAMIADYVCHTMDLKEAR